MPRMVADPCADTLATAGGTEPAAVEPDLLASFLNGNGNGNGNGNVTILCGSECAGHTRNSCRSAKGCARRWCTQCGTRSVSNGARAIISSRADEILDLANTNLWR
jgi:hypothetical protein